MYNVDREDRNLAEYSKLNPEIGIQTNINKYIEDIKCEIRKGNSYFESHCTYPKALAEAVSAETCWKFGQSSADIQSCPRAYRPTGSLKGNNRYITNHKL